MKKKIQVSVQHSKKLPLQSSQGIHPFGTGEAKFQDLIDALYWIQDAMDRASMAFFLIHQTYEDAKNNKDLSGDKIEIGIRKNQWVSGNRRVLDAFVWPRKETATEAIYEYKKVNENIRIPIIVHIYEDSPCIQSLNMIHYMYEEWYVPNPYSEFLKRYG